MPGSDAVYDAPDGEDLFPKTADEHAEMLSWCLDSFNAADRARRGLTKRWRRFELIYRMYVEKRKGDWRSKVFLPIVFYVVETILPRLIAQLPEITVKGVEQQDAASAELMEKLLRWSAVRSDLKLELVKSYKSALKFGTGVLKVYHAHDSIYRKEPVPVMEPATSMQTLPMIDPETGQEMTDLDGNPMVEDSSQDVIDPMTGQPQMVETGEMEWEEVEVVRYDGPKAEAVDIFQFWPAPEASSIDDSRFVIQRVFRDTKFVAERFEAGDYKLPPGMTMMDLESGEESERQKVAIMTDDGTRRDPTVRRAEILEVWTDDTVFTVLNKMGVVRVQDNPFEHGHKPFVRIVDHLQEHSFWGVGEIEPLEGLQDEMNALVNQRIDNVRLVMERMWAFDPDNLHDQNDLAWRPGGGIRIKNKDLNPRDVIAPIELPDVTSSSYQEVMEAERMTEKVSGVNSYTAGGDSDAGQINQTATGASIIAETGNTRFAAKVEMAELIGLNPLAEMFGSILQQFWDEEAVIRIVGEAGADAWVPITAESIQGGFDYSISAQSSAVTESIRKEQAMSLVNLGSQLVRPDGSPVLNVDKLATDMLSAWNITNPEDYVLPPPPPPPPPPMIDPATGQPMMIDPATGQPVPAELGGGGAPPPGQPSPPGPPLEAVQ